MNILEYVFLGLLVLSVFHFTYEGIILPSIRLSLRFKLFALRDELRKAKMKNPNQISNEVFTIVQEGINVALQFLPQFTISFGFYLDREYRANAEFRQRCEKRTATIKECTSLEVQDIRRRSAELMACAFLANSGGLVVYILPAIMGLMCYDFGKSVIRKLLSVSEKEMARLQQAGGEYVAA